MSFSGFKNLNLFTKNGRLTPNALASRIETMETSLYLSASDLFPSSSWDSHVHFEETWIGPTRRIRVKMVKNLNKEIWNLIIALDV